MNKKKSIAVVAALIVLLLGSAAVIGSAQDRAAKREAELIAETVAPPTEAPITAHRINGVTAYYQDELRAGCETYACTSLLQYLGYEIEAYEFADEYLECQPVVMDDNYGILYGPDLNSAFAGDIRSYGWGIYAPGMAKSINNYLTAKQSAQTAKALENVSLEELCTKYINNDSPVMLWATVSMIEPSEDEYHSWTVDYVDENAKYKLGDTFKWPTLEHCLLLCGFDEQNYYFADSMEGEIVPYARGKTEACYQALGMQAVVIE